MHPIIDYLRMNPSERIDYRVQTGLTLQQVVSQATEVGESEKPLLTYKETAELFGVGRKHIEKLANEGLFGEIVRPQRTNFLDANKVYRVLKRQRKKVPIADILEEIEGGEYFISHRSNGKFCQTYGPFDRDQINKKSTAASFAQAARIFYDLRKRKAFVEEWKTVHDLVAELGWDMSPNAASKRYAKMEAAGEIELVTLHVSTREGKRLPHKRFHPAEYRRVLAWERERMGWKTVHDAAKEAGLDLHSDTLERRYRELDQEGAIEITRVPRLLTSQGFTPRIRLSPGQYEKVVGRETRRLADYIREMESRVGLHEVAQLRGTSLGLADHAITWATRHGHVDPLIKGFGKDHRRRLLTREEAGILSDLKVPSPVMIRRLEQERLAREGGLHRYQSKIFPSTLSTLWNLVREGNQSALQFLLDYHSAAITHASNELYMNDHYDSRRAMAQTALWESIMESDAQIMLERRLPGMILDRLAKRKKEEKVAFVHTNPLFEDGEPLEHRVSVSLWDSDYHGEVWN